MAFDFDGNGRVERYTALPAAANDFTAVGWARIDAANPSNPGCIFEIHDVGTSQHFFGSKAGSSTDLACFLNYGTQSKTDFAWNPGSGAWFYWALVNDGGTFTVRCAALASSDWDLEYTFGSTTTDFVADRIACGGNVYSPDENFQGAIGLIKVWDAALTEPQLIAQKADTAVLVATDLLSSHLTDGPDVVSDLPADTGGSSADWTSLGTGTTYVANPVLTSPPSDSITVRGEVVPVGITAVSAGVNEALFVGSSTSATINVAGTDNLPFEGISVALESATPAVATVSGSPATTNAAGVASITVNGVAPGTSTLTATIDGGAVVVTMTVTPVTSVASVTITEPVQAPLGTPVAVTVLALGTSGQPVAGAPVTLASGTLAVATITASPVTTGLDGYATFQLVPVADGTSTLTATAQGGLVSDTATATITDEAVLPPSDSLIATPASVAMTLGGGPVAIAITDAQGAPLSADRALSAQASVSKPGYAQPARRFVSGLLVLTPVAVGSGVVTVVYGDQTNEEASVEIPFTVTS
jgi:hypothetical protein